MKLSTLLRKAANNHLWDGDEEDHEKEYYSCIAVEEAIYTVVNVNGRWSDNVAWNKVYRQRAQLKNRASSFLKELGCPIDASCTFNNFRKIKEKQAARYSWLMFAAQIAKEEGL